MYASPIMCQILLCENSSLFFIFFNLQENEWKHRAASGLASNRAKIQTGEAALSLCYL